MMELRCGPARQALVHALCNPQPLAIANPQLTADLTNMRPQWKAAISAHVDELEGEIIALRRQLHAYPEPSGAELQTSLALYQRLGEVGLTVRMGPDGCGVLADNAAKNGLQRVAVRSDLDALLIQDEKDTLYRSTRAGVMHACGHDAHVAVVYGAALSLAKLERSGAAPWPLAWRAIFQPAEETALGARQMIAAHALDGVSSIFALHVDPHRRTGEVGVRTGAFTASCDGVRIVVTGRGGHGARPHESRDPIAAAAQLISTLYQFIPRVTDSHDAVVFTIGRITGGQNPNVIPEQAELDGTLRTLDPSVRLQTIDHMRRLARGVEEITGTQIVVDFYASIPAVHNDAAATSVVAAAAGDVVGPANVRQIARPSMGGEDFACYLDYCPGAMFRLGVAIKGAETTPLHTPRFDVDERALAIGAKILAMAVILSCEHAAEAAVS